MSGATLPNEAQAWGWYKAHPETAAGRPQPIPGSEEWLVPTKDGLPVEIIPLGSVITAPRSPGSSAQAQRLKTEDKPRITERIRRQGDKRRAQLLADREAEERDKLQTRFDV